MSNAARTCRALGLLAALVVVAATSSACSRATGLEGELVFTYPTVVDPLNFNKPIAVGASLALEIVEVGTEHDVTLLSVESTDPRVIAVTGLDPHEVVVEARSTGTIELQVRARTEDGREVSDRIQLRAAPADRLLVMHACSPDSPEGTYLAGSNAFMYRELRRDSGEPVVGWGRLPVELDPDSGARLIELEREASLLGVQLPPNRGRVTLRSTLDGQRWTLRVIAPEDIDDLTVEYAPRRAFAGDTTGVIATPRAEGQPVCQHRLALEATSLTPSLCRVEPGPPGSEMVEIDALAYGVCRYRVALGSVSHELSLPVGKLPPGGDDDETSGDAVSSSSAEAAIPGWLRQWPAILGLVLLSQVIIGLLAGFVRRDGRRD